MDSVQHVLCRLLHIFSWILQCQRVREEWSQWKWQCAFGQLKRYLGYLCHHIQLCSTVLIQFCPKYNPKKATAQQTDAESLEIYDLLYFILFQLFFFCKTISFIMHCIWFKRPNHIDLVTSLFSSSYFLFVLLLLSCTQMQAHNNAAWFTFAPLFSFISPSQQWLKCKL